MLPLLLSRPSAFMSLPPLVSVSELMLFDFSPWRLGVLSALAGRHLLVDSEAFIFEDRSFGSVNSAPFMPDAPLSWFIVPDAAPPRSEDGAVC